MKNSLRSFLTACGLMLAVLFPSIAIAQPTVPLANTRFSGTNNVVLDAASLKFGTTTPGNISGAAGAITLAAAGTNQNLVWTPSGTGFVLVTGTSALKLGATALAAINVSADTTAGILQLVTPTSGTFTLTTANALSLTVSGGAAATLTGGAGNMTITSGTGNSRTMVLQTTTSGGTATTFLTASITQGVTLANTLAIAGAFSGATTSAFSGLMTMTGTGSAMSFTGAGASRQGMVFANTGASASFGINSSSVTNFFFGDTAYGTAIGTNNSTVFEIGTNNNIRARWTTGGDFNQITTTASTSTTTGSGVFSGGVGIAGAVNQGGKTSTYNNIATEGNGVPGIVKATRITAQSAAGNIATYTTPASDGSYEVSANMNVTAATSLVTTLTCTYTDESNTARTMILPVTQLSGSFIALGAITGTGAWETPVMHIRTKASTAITILTSAGTFTSVTFTAEGIIRQLQ